MKNIHLAKKIIRGTLSLCLGNEKSQLRYYLHRAEMEALKEWITLNGFGAKGLVDVPMPWSRVRKITHSLLFLGTMMGAGLLLNHHLVLASLVAMTVGGGRRPIFAWVNRVEVQNKMEIPGATAHERLLWIQQCCEANEERVELSHWVGRLSGTRLGDESEKEVYQKDKALKKTQRL